MFRKIVSNLPFSPALVGQLSFYAKRLRKEEATRRMGLIFTALALVVQSFAVFSPPEAANASGYEDCSANSIIKCGAQSLSDLRSKYNRNSSGDLHAIYNQYGMTSSIINSGKVEQGLALKNGDITVGGRVVATHSESLGRQNISGSHRKTINGKTYYETSNQNAFLSSSIRVFVFFDSNGRYIGAIMLACGNPLNGTPTKPPVKKCVYNSSLPASSSQCKPCAYNHSIWYKNPKCVPPKTPVAACQSLTKSLVDRTHYKLTGAASAQNGAKIKSYVFTVKDSKGHVVYQKTVTSSATSVTTPSFVLNTAGNYTATLSVSTSVGVKTSSHCQTVLSVAPPEMCALNPSLPKNSPDCKPCEGDHGIWYKDKDCKPEIVHTKTATNLSQGSKDAEDVVAKPGDRIQYIVTVKNTGTMSAKQDIVDHLQDSLEYSALKDTGTGMFDTEGKTLQWSNVTIAPGQSQSRSFVVQVADSIPAINQGTNNPESYDCVMTNSFGDTTNIHVKCPPEKVIVEQTVKELPHTGPRENLIFAGIVLAVVCYFYARSRQLGTEIRLIRRNVNAGTI